MKNIIFIWFFISYVANANIEGSCTIGHEVFFYGTKIVNAKFTERFGTKDQLGACATATDRCHNLRASLDASKFYRCSNPKNLGRFCQVKLIRTKDRVLGIKSWIYKTFKQVKITYGPRMGQIFSSKEKACQAAKKKCGMILTMTGKGKCIVMK